MSDEYFAVILEFNQLEVKLGFAGESHEHVCINHEDPLWQALCSAPPPKTVPSFLDLSCHALEGELRDQFLENIATTSPYKETLALYARDLADKKFYNWKGDKFRSLAKLVKMLVHSRLLVSSQKTKLLVLDEFLSLEDKYLFCEAVLAVGAAVSVSFLPYFECTGLAAGTDDGAIISLQWDSCILSVISDLRCLHIEESRLLTGEALHYNQMSKDNVSDFRRIFGQTFNQSESLANMLSGKSGLIEKLAAIIGGLSIDLRRRVASNLVFCGPIAQIPGLKGRILTELSIRLPGYSISGKQCLGAWAGASLYCSTSLLKEAYSNWTHVELTKENFNRDLMRGLP